MTQQMAVFFPGKGYTCQEELMQGCIEIYRKRGYETIVLDFGNIPFSETFSFLQSYQMTRPLLKKELTSLLEKTYDDLVFVSKSFGTLCAMHVDKEQGWQARHLLLTPLPETLELIEKETHIMAMVIGSEDRYLDPEVMQKFCQTQGIPSLLFEGTGHRLKYMQNEYKTKLLNQQIYQYCL